MCFLCVKLIKLFTILNLKNILLIDVEIEAKVPSNKLYFSYGNGYEMTTFSIEFDISKLKIGTQDSKMFKVTRFDITFILSKNREFDKLKVLKSERDLVMQFWIFLFIHTRNINYIVNSLRYYMLLNYQIVVILSIKFGGC